MKHDKNAKRILIAAAVFSAGSFLAMHTAIAQSAPAPATPPAAATAPADMVGPAAPGPGVFSSRKQCTKLHVAVTGHTFTSRGQIEMYLAYQAADITASSKFDWFSL